MKTGSLGASQLPHRGQNELLFPDADTGQLTCWAPDQWDIADDWRAVVTPFWKTDAGRRLSLFVEGRLNDAAVVYPPRPLNALALTPLAQTRVVIVGQDPYHGVGQAEGLAFSVPAGVKPPPSLRNIFKEILRTQGLMNGGAGDRAGALPASGSLRGWAQQGVLLLNTCLTVEQGQPASHAGRGWEALTDGLIQAVILRPRPLVFMLWGAHAQTTWERVISRLGDSAHGAIERHLILKANHPSPLSALRGPLPFVGCGHFDQANTFLSREAGEGIRWLS